MNGDVFLKRGKKVLQKKLLLYWNKRVHYLSVDIDMYY